MQTRRRQRSQLILEKPIAGDDGFGGNSSAGGWVNEIGSPVGVEFRPQKGSEKEASSAVTGFLPVAARIRAEYVDRFGIDSTWRATEVGGQGRTFNIVSVVVDDADYKWSILNMVFGEVS